MTLSKKTAVAHKEPSPTAEGYGTLFAHPPGGKANDIGRKHTDDAIRVLEHRLTRNHLLRKLPLTPAQRQSLTKKCMKFLKDHEKSPFEVDNYNHVGRLLTSMKRFSGDLKTFLEIDHEDLQCLAALHDLGKAQVPTEMYSYLVTVFGADDFIGLRVLPHELYSVFWIQDIGNSEKLSQNVIETLMDQISNHNFGPNLNDPINEYLLAKLPTGQFRHWWVEHWREWTERAAKKGLVLNPVYGYTESPLANALVLFDRIDNGHPHSWEKFLNQDLLSGKLLFTPENIIKILEETNLTAREQIRAVGRQLRTQFTGKKKHASVEDFSPFIEAQRMLALNDSVVNRLNESNEPSLRAQFGQSVGTSILYQDRNQLWSRVEGSYHKGARATRFEWEDSQWVERQSSESPVELLLETIYRDWNLSL